MNFKKSLSVLIAAIIVFACFFTFNVAAVDGISLQFSSSTIEIGNKVVVTVVLDPYDKMLGAQADIQYDSELLKLDSYDGDCIINTQNPSGKIPVVFSSLTGKKSFIVKLTFSPLKTGTGSISVKNCIYSYQPSQGALSQQKEFGGAGQSAVLTVKDKQLPDNANLSSLTLSTGVLSPKFSPATTKYTVSVPYEAANITLYANKSDTKANVAISSNPTQLKVGANTITVTVTAQNGSQKIYTVVVTRKAEGEVVEPDDTTSQPTVQENPYEAVISGKSYEIVTTIPENKYLKGFTLSSAEYRGTQVPVLRDKDNVYTVYYLRESGTAEAAPYVYDSDLSTFEALKYIVANDSLYIFADFPKGVTMEGNYYSTYVQIGEHSVKAYLDSNTQMSDFSYVYCYVNGTFGLYRYDSKEGSIQRYPDMHFIDAPIDETDNKVKPDNFITRFASLSTNGKILLIAMLVAAICVVVLIVLLIVSSIRKLVNNDISNPYIESNYAFDDVIIVGEENENTTTEK